MKKYTNMLLVTLLLSPTIALAELTGTKDLITAVEGLINPLIGVLVGLALLAFFWGLAKFIFRAGGDEKAVEEGKKIMKWGLIALFIMISVWGIISFIQSELNLSAGTGPNTGAETGGPFDNAPSGPPQ